MKDREIERLEEQKIREIEYQKYKNNQKIRDIEDQKDQRNRELEDREIEYLRNRRLEIL